MEEYRKISMVAGEKKQFIKLLYVVTKSNIGGVQVHLIELIDQIGGFIEPHFIVGETGWLYDELIKRNINVYCIKNIVREISPINDIRAIFAIRKIIKKIKPDIVHCHSSKAGIVGRIAAKLCGIPALFTAHGWAFTEGVAERKRKIYKIIERIVANFSDKIICVSEYDKQLALKTMPEQAQKLILVHNGIRDIKNINRKEEKLPVRFVMVARFMEPKDQESLLKALFHISQDNIEFLMTFVGDGEKLKLAKQMARELKLDKYVRFLGTRNDVKQILYENDIFLLISRWEGFPISVLEALRAGMPVVASNVGGIPEIVVNNYNGFLVERDDLNSLVDSLKKLVQNRKLITKMGHNGRERFQSEFTSKKMAKIVLEVYKNLIEG